MNDRENLIEQMSIWVNAKGLSKYTISVSCADVAERYYKDKINKL